MNGNYMSLLKNQKFTFLWSGSLISGIGDSISTLAIIWVIYNQTQNPFMIALALICLEVPAILFGPLWGVYLDRHPRIMLVTSNVVRGMLFIFLIFIDLNSGISYSLFLFLLALSSSMQAITEAGENLFVPRLVSKEQLVPANSLMNIQFDFALAIGPVVGGFLAYSSHSNIAFAINAGTFFLAAIIFWYVYPKTMKIESRKEEHSDSPSFSSRISAWNRELLEGIRYIKNETVIRGLIVINFVWNLLVWGTIPTLLPIFNTNQLSSNAQGYGLLLTSTSVGIILGSILIGIWKTRMNIFHLVFFSVILHGLVYMLLATTSNLWIAGILLTLGGIVSAPALIYTRTLVQSLVPKTRHGRVFTVIGSFGAVGFPIGTLLASSLVTSVGNNNVFIAFIIFGGIIVFTTFVLYMSNKKVVAGDFYDTENI